MILSEAGETSPSSSGGGKNILEGIADTQASKKGLFHNVSQKSNGEGFSAMVWPALTYK